MREKEREGGERQRKEREINKEMEQGTETEGMEDREREGRATRRH